MVADPNRLATLVPHLEGVSAVCWLLGSADDGAIHGPQLESFLEHVVDTPVRAVFYEPSECHPGGREIARRAADRHRMTVEVLDGDDTARAVARALR